MWGSEAPFGTFLENEPLDLGLVAAKRWSRMGKPLVAAMAAQVCGGSRDLCLMRLCLLVDSMNLDFVK